MRFTAYGHENVLSTHPTTVEFTKDNHLTRRGDCILAINADFRRKAMAGKIKITILVDDLKEEIIADANPHFDADEMVIRKSSFLDRRTFAINATKAAKDIRRDIVEKLKDPDQEAKITISIIE